MVTVCIEFYPGVNSYMDACYILVDSGFGGDIIEVVKNYAYIEFKNFDKEVFDAKMELDVRVKSWAVTDVQ